MDIKKIVFGVIALCSLVMGTILFIPTTDIHSMECGEFIYVTDKQNIQVPLKTEDLKLIIKLFNHKTLFHDNPSCGFSENVSISINSNQYTFCLARDGCPIIYLTNEDMFFRLTTNEHNALVELLEKYGLVLPCL